MKTKHDKAIDGLIQSYLVEIWWNSDCDCRVEYLCTTFRITKYNPIWKNYWKRINDRNLYNMDAYFYNWSTTNEKNLLRLLIVEDFKKYVNKNRKRYGLD